jgi:CheY-like chemotaxis protein
LSIVSEGTSDSINSTTSTGTVTSKNRNYMNRNGPVIIIEDDLDDQEILSQIFKQLNYSNEVVFFSNADDALAYLSRTDIFPFLIMSDINMPRLNGFELRTKIKTDTNLQIKCIPYLFFTTASSEKAVIEAYSASVQGFFVKQNSFVETRDTIKAIMEYWKRCASPNNF